MFCIAYAGGDVIAIVNVTDDTGAHVAATVNTTTTRLDHDTNNYSATAPTVRTIGTGIYEIKFTSLSPALAEGEIVTVKVNGSIDGGSAWTEYGVPIMVVEDIGTIDTKIDTVDTNVDAILVDTGTTLPATLTTIEGKVDTVDTVVDAVLVDTGTTLPGTLSTIEGKVDTVDTVVDSILVDTAEIGAAGAGLTAIPWNASWDAEVQSECADALTAYDPATGAEIAALDTKIDTIDGVVDSILVDTAAIEVVTDKVNTALEDDGSSGFQFTTLALENAPGGGGGGDATSANQTTIISALTAIQGAGFVTGTDSLEAIRDRGDAAWITGSATISTEDRDAIVSGVVTGLGGTEVTVSQPIAEDGTTITIVRGDDYSSSDSREITWTGASEDQWPDLTSATIRMTAVRKSTVLNFTPVVTSPTGTQTLQLELTSDDTTVPSGRYQYDMQATLNGSAREVTLLRGVMNVEVSHVTANE